MGPMGKVMGMIPGMSEMMKQVNMKDGDIERSLKRMQAMYHSMTVAERKKPELIEHGRRRRIARGAGVDTGEVGKFIKDFEQTRDAMRAIGSMGIMGKFKMMRALAKGDLAGLGMPGGPMLKTKKSGFMEKKDRNKKKKRR
jgi:signal recognition particle subunit SRP54